MDPDVEPVPVLPPVVEPPVVEPPSPVVPSDPPLVPPSSPPGVGEAEGSLPSPVVPPPAGCWPPAFCTVLPQAESTPAKSSAATDRCFERIGPPRTSILSFTVCLYSSCLTKAGP